MQYQPPPPVFGLYGLYGYAARLLVTHGYVGWLRSPVTHGYVNSPKRCVTDRFHGYARNCVIGQAKP